MNICLTVNYSNRKLWLNYPDKNNLFINFIADAILIIQYKIVHGLIKKKENNCCRMMI